jgi:enterochelin esterase family protein
MIVVMPDGHTGPARGLALAEFAEEFATDIKPYVEANYRIRDGRGDTAVAGLSLGGAHTLEIAMSDLGEYAYIGVFSSGVFSINQGDEWQTQYAATLEDARLRDGLEYFWFAIGSDDFLLDTATASIAMFREHGFDVAYHESAGGHTWTNWREYLNDFAPKLFR